MRGIILAGGAGTRLHPLTLAVSKQLLPVYDKPLIFYPLSTLILAGIDDILVITTPRHARAFQDLLGDGAWCGVSLQYAVQDEPRGLAQAFTLRPDFIAGQHCCLILGDNLFHGVGLGQNLARFATVPGATIFHTWVADPSGYGVVEFDAHGAPAALAEKPRHPRSHEAVPGLYFYDDQVAELAAGLQPSDRDEYEITDLNRRYLERGLLRAESLPRGTAWFDIGTVDALVEASTYVRALQQRQGLLLGSPEEAAWRLGRIGPDVLLARAAQLSASGYGEHLRRLVTESDER